jgi:hypothetical protein
MYNLTKRLIPQGSVIGTHREIELVTPMYETLSSRRRALYSRTRAVCRLAAGMLVGDKMSCFDYGAAAELFPGRQHSRIMGATYMRFAAAAEAVRYAIEVLPAKLFLGTFLEVDEERFNSGEIRRLYDSVEYPLRRRPAAIQDRSLSVRRAS